MKSLKVLVIVSLMFTMPLMAKNITAKDLGNAKIQVEDVNKANKIYSECLNNYENHCSEAIIMVVLKQKMLYPNADYDCLIKPLKKIIKNSNNDDLRNNALTALVILTKDFNLNLTEEQLYNFEVNDFFAFVNYQLPKNLVLVSGNQN